MSDQTKLQPKPARPDPQAHDPRSSIAEYKALFSSLDPDLPLALLPLRIETRFSPQGEPAVLTVRIYPDAIHADAHARELTASEQALGCGFWERSWRAGPDTAAKDEAFAWLANQLGPWRASWVARSCKPLNIAAAPTQPIPDAQPLVPFPKFPKLELRESAVPTRARLLPQRFAVAGYVDNELAGTWFGAPIPEELPLAPALVDVAAGGAEEFLTGQGLNWLHDIDAALAVGMALRIDLNATPAAVDGFDRLIVFGIREGDARIALEELLEAQRYSRGLELAPQGMPTNRGESAAATMHPAHPNLAQLRVAELEAPAPVGRPEIASEGALYRLPFGDAVSVALGLGKDNALDKCSQVGNPQLAQAEAMNRGLWPALLGGYLRELLGGILDADARDWLRDWSTAFVRGGASLPTLLVGTQPYGVLPICRIDPHHPAVETPKSNVAHVENVVCGLRQYWELSLPGVAHLDPNASDAPGGELTDGQLAATVSKVLGSVPHPTGLTLRTIEPKRDEYADAYDARMFLLGFLCSQFRDAHGNSYPDEAQNPAWRRFEQLEDDEARDSVSAFESAAFDFHHTSSMDGIPFTTDQRTAYETLADFIDDQLLTLVNAHHARVAPVSPFVSSQTSDVSFRVGDATDPQAFFAYHGETGSETAWTLPLVAGAHSAADVAAVGEWLAALANGSVSDKPRLPMLQALLGAALDKASAGAEHDLLQAGIRTLQAQPQASTDPIGELERLLRETLGPASYRLDAWHSAVAAWRLENRRAQHARGIQIGAYGFVVDVRRRDSKISQGYIAAPSMPLATTAAVLRAGWSALGGSTESAGLAVNLSSERIRRAAWLLDGVRRGQELGRLLGARLERRLHDAGLDTWIEPLREIALAATATASAALPNTIVDGVLLARARSGLDDLDAAERAARDAIDALLAEPDRPAGNPRRVLAELVRDLDAVADAISAQSVHALTRGNIPTATAALTTASSGEISPPALTFADTPRPALLVHHRLVLLVDPDARGHWPGAATSGRALAAPGLEAWAEGVLGDPAAIKLTLRFVNANGADIAPRLARTLADTGLAALDVLYLAPRGEETGLGRLGDAFDVWAETQRPAELAGATIVVEGDMTQPDLAAVTLAARALCRLIAEGRDLDARDLVEPNATELADGIDPADVPARESALRKALVAAHHRLAAAASAREQRAALLPLVGYQLPGALTVPASQALATHVALVLAGIDARLLAHDERVAAHAPRSERLALLVGHALPLAPRVLPTDGATLDASIARDRSAGATAVCGWLNQAGRVDPGAHRLRVAIDLCEAAADSSLFDFRLAQLPDHPHERWAAIARPSADERGRLCILMTGARPSFATDKLAGLVVGGWNEAIPRSTPAAGLAVHYDASSTRAPQAVLLCVARDDLGFDFGGVRDNIAEALALARLRMVGPESLLNLGQYLPATYLPNTIHAGAAK
ncbi:MAG TPA: hypothetical protein VK550_00560 [Polyangiaceae bacterium]|nr:hypothetical protein [Polyangiaceae bacterium]